jgi:SM-20-related protein
MESDSQQLEFKNVKVQLLLAGGHQYTIYLNSDAPVLHSLLTTIVARAYTKESPSNCLFQIPLNDGHSALCFSSEHLIGVITEPPIWVKQMEDIALINTKH